MTKLTFYGGAKNVTGANYLLEETDQNGDVSTRILVDCGLKQGKGYCEEENFGSFPYDPSSIDALIITHAHIDHTGRIPKLYKDGFRGTIYATPPTKDFVEHLLIDSEHILSKEAEDCGLSPMYDIEDVNQALSLWETVPYHTKTQIKDIEFELYDAGHTLGSSFVAITTKRGKKILFSGDLGNTPVPLLKDTEDPPQADYILVESTYGNRTHEDVAARKSKLKAIIEDTVKRKGVLMIPAFALERTQEILFELNDLVEQNKIPKVPIYIDSPLAIKLTSIYKKYSQNPSYFDKEAIAYGRKGDEIFDFQGLHLTLTRQQSKEINETPAPKIIIAGSGMSEGGRILHHEKRYLSDKNNTILFVGYQAEQSRGRKILQRESPVEIHGEMVHIECAIKAIGGYSSHADREKLLQWLKPAITPSTKVFVVQGEEDQMIPFSEKIQSDLGAAATIPSPGDTEVLT